VPLATTPKLRSATTGASTICMGRKGAQTGQGKGAAVSVHTDILTSTSIHMQSYFDCDQAPPLDTHIPASPFLNLQTLTRSLTFCWIWQARTVTREKKVGGVAIISVRVSAFWGSISSTFKANKTSLRKDVDKPPTSWQELSVLINTLLFIHIRYFHYFPLFLLNFLSTH